MKAKLTNKLAVRNPLTRAPIIPATRKTQGTGLGTANVPRVSVAAVLNPLARGR